MAESLHDGQTYWYEQCPECGAMVACNDLRFFPAHRDERNPQLVCFAVDRRDD